LAPAFDPVIADQLVALRHEAWRVAGHVLGERGALAEDAVAEAYLHAVRHLSREPVRELRSWFLRVTVNATRDLARSERARQRREAEKGEHSMSSTTDSQPDPALVAKVCSAMGNLDERYRLPLALRYESGLSQIEIAEVLELPQGTVASQLKRGLDRLRELLGASSAVAAPTVLSGAISAGAAVQAPASLLGIARTILSTGALPAAKAGVASSAAMGTVFAGWKLLAALAAAGLSLGTWGVWMSRGARTPEDPPRPAQIAPPKPSPQPGKTPATDKLALALDQEVVIPRGWMGYYDIFNLVHRKCGIRVYFPRNAYRSGLKLPVGRMKVDAVLRRVAARCNLSLETATYHDAPTVFFWRRPDPETFKRLASLAASEKETERCIAARWLPAAGSKQAWKLALALLADPSERVRRYGYFGIGATFWSAGWYGVCVDPLRYLAPPELEQSLAAELKAIVEKRKAARPAGRAGRVVRMAGRFAYPECLSPLLEIIDIEFSREKSVMVTRRKRGSSYGYSVSPRDPKKLRDSQLLTACVSTLARFKGPAAERAVLKIFSRLKGLDRQYLFAALAGIGKPATDKLLLDIALDPEEGDYLRSRALNHLASAGRKELVTRLLVLARAGKLEAKYLTSQQMLRTGHPGVLELALAQLRGTKDPKTRRNLCWNICVATDKGEKVIPEIVEILKLPGGGMTRDCSTVITALGFTGSPKAIPVLESLLKSKTRRVPSRAALALGQLGTPEAVDLLIGVLKDGDLDLKCGAAQALGDTGDLRALPVLRDVVKSSESRLRMLALRGIGKLGGDAEVALLVAASNAADLIKDPRTGKMRPSPYKAPLAALNALGVIGGERAAKALEKAVIDGKPEAFRILLTSSDPALLRALKRTIVERGDRSVSTIVTARMGYIGDRAILCSLVPGLIAYAEKAGLPAPRSFNTGRCLNLGDPRQIEAIVQMLGKHQDAAVRKRAALMLVAKGRNANMLVDPLAAEALLRAVRRDPDPALRADIIRWHHGLRMLEPEKSLLVMLAAAESDADPRVRQVAAEKLPAGPYLTRHIPRIKRALAREKNARVRKALQKALKDWDRHTADILPKLAPPKVKKPPVPEVF
jgi:RNA polymerase sigma factor (sigma-70 family)